VTRLLVLQASNPWNESGEQVAHDGLYLRVGPFAPFTLCLEDAADAPVAGSRAIEPYGDRAQKPPRLRVRDVDRCEDLKRTRELGVEGLGARHGKSIARDVQHKARESGARL
jgi:hypothetical protein